MEGGIRSEGKCRHQGQYPGCAVDFEIPHDPDSARCRIDKGLLIIFICGSAAMCGGWKGRGGNGEFEVREVPPLGRISQSCG